MKIRRITKVAIKENKNKIERKDRFSSANSLVDTIELDESLFTNYYAKWSEATREVFATDDFIKVEFEHGIDIIERKIILDNTIEKIN